MKLVAARLGDGGDDPSTGSAVFGTEVDGLDLEFTDRFHSHLHTGYTARQLATMIHQVSPVQEIAVGALPGARYAHINPIATQNTVVASS